MRRLRRAAPKELEAGDNLGDYGLEQLLGEGGMGLVFRAVRKRDGEVVALKVLRDELAHDGLFRRRFAQEARAATEVRDRHLVPILDAGEIDGRHYLAVRYAEGGSLEERIREQGPLGIEETLRLADDVGTGLDALHAAGLVHRDLKASNVVFDRDGTAMLTDFGLAKGRAYTVLTRPGQVVGTAHYMAPELIKGETATPASDIYALGCTVFECLTGTTPFGEKTLFMVGLAHVEDSPPSPAEARPELGAAAAEAVLTALEKDPERRPLTAGAYAARLRAALDSPLTREPSS